MKKQSQSSSLGSLARQLAKTGLSGGSSYLGGLVGGPIGASFGDKLGTAIGNGVFGHGDYVINSNSLVKGNPVPEFRDGKRSVIIKHREYLTDILSSTSFSNRSYNVNAGLSATFPWLSSIATGFEQYRFHGLLFEFISTAGSAIASTNNALGTVIMASEYNVNKPLFAYKQQMEAYEFACANKPSESFVHPLECDPAEVPLKMYYVRNATDVDDKRFSDLAIFQLATQGMQAANINIGELWVTYEVELFKPLLIPSLYIGNSLHYKAASPTALNYYGPIITSPIGSFAVTFTAVGGGYDTITFPVSVISGVYKLVWTWYGTPAACSRPNRTFTNCSALSIYRNNLDTAEDSAPTANTGTFILEVVISVNAASGTPAVVTLSGGVLPTAMTYMDLFIAQMAPSVIT